MYTSAWNRTGVCRAWEADWGWDHREIDPVYDSDDTDAQGPVNTIGNIPLSFYDRSVFLGLGAVELRC